MAQACRFVARGGVSEALSLCLASAGVVKALSVASFMLAWTHSVEKVEWQEDWRVTPQGLEIAQARIKGSGAGMEPPPDAKLVDGWYRWTPTLKPLPDVVLGNSGVAGEWRICTNGNCQTLSSVMGRPIGTSATTMSVCKGDVKGDAAQALDAKTLTARADDLNVRGDFDRAISDYDAALKVDPVFVDALNGRASAWRAKGDRKRALADLDAALKIRPDFEPARKSRKDLFREIELLGARMPLKPNK